MYFVTHLVVVMAKTICICYMYFVTHHVMIIAKIKMYLLTFFLPHFLFFPKSCVFYNRCAVGLFPIYETTHN